MNELTDDEPPTEPRQKKEEKEEEEEKREEKREKEKEEEKDKDGEKEKEGKEEKEEEEDEEDEEEEDEEASAPLSAPIVGDTWKDVKDNLRDRIAKGLPSKEFEIIGRIEIPDASHYSVAISACGRNRYRNILPYDSTRIVLKTDLECSNDYINASRVELGGRTWIAATAPPKCCFYDWWRMIWQENATVVVALTRWTEGNNIKADDYLPKEETHRKEGEGKEEGKEEEGLNVGTFVVNSVGEPVRTTDFVVRKLMLGKKVGGGVVVSRPVTHYQYVSWPDRGAPSEYVTLMKMMSMVEEGVDADGGTTVVHCSAGVGRSGTWMALSFLRREVDAALASNRAPVLDPMLAVKTLRDCRNYMVQAIDQYLYIYQALDAYVYDALANRVDKDLRPQAKSDRVCIVI